MKKILAMVLVMVVGVVSISAGSMTVDSRGSEHTAGVAACSTTHYRSGSRMTGINTKAKDLIETQRKNRAEASKAAEAKKSQVQTTPVVQEQPLVQEEAPVPVVDITEEEIVETPEANQNTAVCDGRFHTNGICDGTCVGNDGSTGYGHHNGNGNGVCDGSGHANGICDGSCVNYGNQGVGQAGGAGICDGSGHGNGICDGSCVNAGQGAGQGNGQGTGGYGHSSSHGNGNGHGNGHRR